MRTKITLEVDVPLMTCARCGTKAAAQVRQLEWGPLGGPEAGTGLVARGYTVPVGWSSCTAPGRVTKDLCGPCAGMASVVLDYVLAPPGDRNVEGLFGALEGALMLEQEQRPTRRDGKPEWVDSVRDLTIHLGEFLKATRARRP